MNDHLSKIWRTGLTWLYLGHLRRSRS